MFYRVFGPSAAENFILEMLKNVGFSMVFALREGKIVPHKPGAGHGPVSLPEAFGW